MICTKCGAELPDDANECSVCGEPVPSAEDSGDLPVLYTEEKLLEYPPDAPEKPAQAKKAEAGAKALFGGAGDLDNIPAYELSADDASDIVTILVKTGLCSSNGDARRNIQQGGVTVNDEKVTDFKKTFTDEELKTGILVKRGKKNFFRVTKSGN